MHVAMHMFIATSTQFFSQPNTQQSGESAHTHISTASSLQPAPACTSQQPSPPPPVLESGDVVSVVGFVAVMSVVVGFSVVSTDVDIVVVVSVVIVVVTETELPPSLLVLLSVSLSVPLPPWADGPHATEISASVEVKRNALVMVPQVITRRDRLRPARHGDERSSGRKQ
jgi:hypothetical protein